MWVFWIVATIGGLALTIFSSQQTLESAKALAVRLGLSPFIIGMTIVAIGTDLPEIANSITASANGHGDINVGDSIGSVVTQITLVLGILCFIRPMPAERKLVAIGGAVTVLAVLIGAVFLADESLGRGDAAVLIAFWVVGSLAVQQRGHIVTEHQLTLLKGSLLNDVRGLMVGLGGVAIGSIIAIQGFTEVAMWLKVPEYATSFLLLSLGTSLPELVVDAKALRSGEHALALGDIIGSSFVDATISLGIGPLLFPITVNASAAKGSLLAAVIVAAALGLLMFRREHGRSSGIGFLLLYASAYLVIIA